MRRRFFESVVMTALMSTMLAGGARADAIDGDWCGPGGLKLSIRGPALVTPGGARLDGSYDRHFFSYLAPPAERDAGQTVAMTLVNEETVHLRRGADLGSAAQQPVEVWRRCAPGISDAAASPPAVRS
jgi:hypothetical protein